MSSEGENGEGTMTTSPKEKRVSSQVRKVRGMMLDRVDIIFNPVSGTGDPDSELNFIKEHLETGFHKVVVHKTTPEVEGDELTRNAIEDGAQVIVASGGDGTVACCAAAISQSGSKATLGVIPRGTANAFCAALGIPSDLQGACEQILRGNTRNIDVPYVDGKPMMLLLGIGLEAQAVRRADRGLKRAIGALAYIFSGIKSMAQQSKFQTTITMQNVEDNLSFGGKLVGEKIELKNLKVTEVTVANSAPATSVLAQGIGAVRPDDGLLEVVCLAAEGLSDTVDALTSMFSAGVFRTRVQRADLFGLRAREVYITCDPPQHVVVDGEEVGKTPVRVKLDPENQIQVLAPKAKVLIKKQRKFGRFLTRFLRNMKGIAVFSIAIALLSRSKKAKTPRLICE